MNSPETPPKHRQYPDNSACEEIHWEPGKILLGDYRIERFLGRGGMGTVYLVSCSRVPGLELAVKTLLPTRMGDQETQQQFIRELKTWMDLPAHPNLAACRFFRTIENRSAIFNEYVSGGTLSDWIYEHKLLVIKDILRVTVEIAWGLQALHERNIIHQDFKPANVLMTPEGVPKITDYGLARVVPEPIQPGLNTAESTIPEVTTTGMTLAYCSPEQASGGRITFRTDMWGFGLTLLQMFVGKVFWHVGSLANRILDNYLADSPNSPFPVMPESVITFLRRCFQETPLDRWPDMYAAAEALTEIYSECTGNNFPIKAPSSNILPGAVSPSVEFQKSAWNSPEIWLEQISKICDLDIRDEISIPGDPGRSRRTAALTDLEVLISIQRIIERKSSDDTGTLNEMGLGILKDIGRICQFLNDYPGALAVYEKIETRYCRLPEPGTPEFVPALLRYAEIILKKAAIFERVHQFAEVLDLVKPLADLLKSEESPDNLEDLDQLTIMTANKIGSALSRSGEPRAALETFQQAMPLIEHSSHRQGDDGFQLETAGLLRHFGNTYCMVQVIPLLSRYMLVLNKSTAGIGNLRTFVNP